MHRGRPKPQYGGPPYQVRSLDDPTVKGHFGGLRTFENPSDGFKLVGKGSKSQKEGRPNEEKKIGVLNSFNSFSLFEPRSR